MTCETPDAQPAALSPEGWGGLSSEELARTPTPCPHPICTGPGRPKRGGDDEDIPF